MSADTERQLVLRIAKLVRSDKELLNIVNEIISEVRSHDLIHGSNPPDPLAVVPAGAKRVQT